MKLEHVVVAKDWLVVFQRANGLQAAVAYRLPEVPLPPRPPPPLLPVPPVTSIFFRRLNPRYLYNRFEHLIYGEPCSVRRSSIDRR